MIYGISYSGSMWQNFEKIDYDFLQPKQKENFNYQKVAAAFADYGFNCIKLNDDWNGADFIAHHIDGKTFFRIQLKARLTFAKKYINKELWICFPYLENIYCYPHDKGLTEVRSIMIQSNNTDFTAAYNWTKNEMATWPYPTKIHQAWLDEKYKLN